MEKHEQIAQAEDDIRHEGELAFMKGDSIEHCPHRSHTRPAELWRRGFANAQFGAQASKQRGFQ